MEPQTTLLTTGSREKRKLPMLLMLVMWSLGIIEWSQPSDDEGSFHRPFIGNSKWRRRLVFTFTMLSFLVRGLITVLGATCYVICYFGKANHILGFISTLLCYWPPIIYAPVLCLIAIFRNMSRTHHDDDRSITCMKVLSESGFTRQISHFRASRITPLPKVGVFIIFHGLAFILSFLIFLHYEKKPCRTWLSLIWVAAEIISIFFFATFSYFVYLQRVILEEEGKQMIIFISKSKGELDICITKIQQFFCNYIQLRRLLLPWLCMILFSLTFGLTAFMMWTYKKSNPSNNTHMVTTPVTTTAANPTFVDDFGIIDKLCPYSCDNSDQLGQGAIFWGKVVMSFVLTFVVIQGLDLKYVWDNFTLKLDLMFSAKELKFWECLTNYVKELHPNVAFDTLFGFVIPVLAIAIGVLGEGNNIL
ncbi:hypothetical protein HOLleu_33379 [Holothuria leucospilota]|uniref:Uncharacterized protein n=1 Tax=Holothuria leucospilota TaxID=206669 RepID=A0A9Q0YNH9_HOLLE|nr:hypothetical protein HOLleu_33379 [Holothuria leucospilota]